MFGLVESITNLIKPAAKPLKTQILYSSLSSTTKKLAEQLSTLLLTESEHLNSSIDTLDNLDLDSLINQTPIDTVNQLIIFLLPSYNVESPVDSVLSQFRDALYDFRLDKNSLAGLSFFVIGIGHSDYQNEFCKQAVELDSIIANLGARRIINLKKIDVSVDPEKDLSDYFQTVIRTTLSPSLSSFAQLPPLSSSSEDDDNDEDENSDDEFKDYTSSKPLTKAEKARQKSSTKKKKSSAGTTKEGTMDIEDLGTGIPQIEDLDIKDQDDEIIKKDMISPMTRKSLTKQGYAIVGSHSAVKTCRWTKASLRGRGFCYKHAFYGIQSHQCMEATPSLACANKCTFCWRAHTNPVGTSWRWKTDSAEYIIEESLKEHDRLIKQLSGMPGVRADRFTEARTPRHAALSLVGEPVMFPHIKKYISLLTEKRISTFLVTNAQFPESLKDLPPVTQLYLSIDAGTKESLKTVFRLTIVKGENENQIKEYADLVRRGQPDFIEVKGVTYCGYPGSSNLTIKNSPWHEESKDGSTLEYGLAAEHAHSCCVLAAHSKYYFDDKWHTWIDYDKFFELVEAGSTDFDGLDYCDITPDFALFNSAEAGFSPEDQRWFRKKTLAAQKEKLDQLNQDHQKEDDQNILPPPIGPSQ
ncbi:hypothetical protein KEM48_009866 [Puccinia striiformis f. sp. tritici PST-130]|nr:hypothetical protein KEM48_009866 [Puccinia striiformis f. sp. tritici PST-130]